MEKIKLYEVDIHAGKPSVKCALEFLEVQIKLARKTRTKAMKIIVGYGSSGGSHKIKTASISYLEGLVEQKQIKAFILGTELDIFSEKYRNFKYTNLIPDEEKRMRNPGVIIIIL